MDFEPLESGATAPQMVRGINATHHCLEAHKVETNKRFDGLDEKIALILLALGIDPSKPDATRPRRTLATLTPWQLALAFMFGVGPVIEFWRWVLQLSPAAWAFFLQLNHIVGASR